MEKLALTVGCDSKKSSMMERACLDYGVSVCTVRDTAGAVEELERNKGYLLVILFLDSPDILDAIKVIRVLTMGIIDGGTKNKAIRIFSFFQPFVYHIVPKHTTSFTLTAIAANTIPDRFRSKLDDFCFYPFCLKRLGNFGQRQISTAVIFFSHSPICASSHPASVRFVITACSLCFFCHNSPLVTSQL